MTAVDGSGASGSLKGSGEPSKSYEEVSGSKADGEQEQDAFTWARVDHARQQRTGLPEVIFAEGKTEEQVACLVDVHLRRQGCALATRVSNGLARQLQRTYPEGAFRETARLWWQGSLSRERSGPKPRVAVVCAGTSDLPVAEEARWSAEWFGLRTSTHYDVGVAGLDRLLDQLDELRSCQLVIAVAGMDGAMPAVLAGQLPLPVVAVPTSVGYGASFEGIAPLLTMLSSCAPGVSVVNIDSGFGAAAFAAKALLR